MEMARVTSKGQITIPRDIRANLQDFLHDLRAFVPLRDVSHNK